MILPPLGPVEPVRSSQPGEPAEPAEPAKPAEPAEAPPNPWWIPPFFGRVPAVDPLRIRLLGFVSLALLFDNYDFSLLGLALRQITQDLQISESDLGFFTMAIRLGALPAFLVIPFADRIGRRRLFLIAVIGISLGSTLTAFSQDALHFIVCQMVTRIFMVTAMAVAFVMVAEEFPAAHRGWAIGALGAVSSLGWVVGGIMYSMVEVLPFGWRALYFLGIAPLLLLPWFRRGITETARFVQYREETAGQPTRGALASWFAPLREFARSDPRRSFGIAAVGGLTAVGQVAAFQLLWFFIQSEHGWSPGQVSAMYVVAGALGIFGNIVAGRLGDRIGRRIVGAAALVLFPISASLVYQGPGWLIPLVWFGMIFASEASKVILRAFAAELFPTGHRSTSSGWLALLEALGAAAGLGLLGIAQVAGVSIPDAVSLIGLACIAGGALMFLFPETRQQELEALNEGR